MSNNSNLNKSFPNIDFELSLAIIERDTTQYRKERLDKLILELQAKTSIVEEKTPDPKQPQTIKEITFIILIYETRQGIKLGTHEVATKPKKEDAKWIYAYNILRKQNATIQDRYHEEGYQYSYWLFDEDKIYRQKLKEKQ
jgi:hypothetical protein